jgi:hypothetical protein
MSSSCARSGGTTQPSFSRAIGIAITSGSLQTAFSDELGPCTRLCERPRRRRLSAQRGGRETFARLGRRRRRDAPRGSGSSPSRGRVARRLGRAALRSRRVVPVCP